MVVERIIWLVIDIWKQDTPWDINDLFPQDVLCCSMVFLNRPDKSTISERALRKGDCMRISGQRVNI